MAAGIIGLARLLLLFEQRRYFGGQPFVVLGKLLDQRVLRRQLQAGGAEDGIEARGVHRDPGGGLLDLLDAVKSAGAGRGTLP